jgi:glycosyltransferase involved in cell wall biosynthesis
MKIAFIGTRGVPASYGGTETYVDRLTQYFAATGDEVVVYCKKSDSAEQKKAADALYPKNVRRIEMPSIASKHLDNITRSLFSTLHVCFDSSVDVVQFNNVGPAFFSLLPKLFGKKVVGAIRAIDSQRDKWNFFAKTFLRFCDFVTVKIPHATTVNSLAMRTYYLDKYNEETLYIPNGLEIPQGQFTPNFIKQFGLERKKYILFAARLEPEKGCHTLIAAFKKAISEADSDVKLVIAGHHGFSTDYYTSLMGEASDRIQFLGYVSSQEGLNELFHNAYAFILPSSVEGMSNSLLSAMSHAVPCVISDIPENLALFDGSPLNASLKDCPGLSFKLEDSDSLSERLLYLLNNPEEAELRGELLKEHVEANFALATMCENTRAVYAGLLS